MGTDTRTGGLALVLADGWTHAAGNVRTFDVVPGEEDAADYAANVLRAEREHAEAEASWARSQGDADGDRAADAEALAAATVAPFYVEDDRTGAWRVGSWTVTLGDGSRFHVHAFPDGTASGAWAVDDGHTSAPWEAWWDARALAEAHAYVMERAAEAVRVAARGGAEALAEAAAAYADVAEWAAEADAATVAADVATFVAEEWAARVAWDTTYAANRAAAAVRDALALGGRS